MTRSRASFARRRGYALASAMVVLMLGSVLGISLLSVSLNSLRMSVLRNDRTRAFDIAEAGLRHNLVALRNNRNLIGERPETAFGGGTFQVTISTPDATRPNQRLLRSVGQVTTLGNRVITRRVRALVDTRARSAIWDYAIITEGPLSLGGSINVSSTPTPGGGHIHSNSNTNLSVSLNGSNGLVVDGRASAVGNVSLTGSPVVTGGVESNAPRVPFPPLDTVALSAEADALGIRNGNLTIPSGTSQTLSGKINGNLTVRGSATISGLVWVTGTINLNGGALVGDGALISEGQMTLGGNVGYAADPDAGNRFALVSLRGPASQNAINVQGGAVIKSGLYAPNGAVNIAGSAAVQGTIATQEVVLQGSPSLRRNTAFDPPTEVNRSFRVLYWQEQ